MHSFLTDQCGRRGPQPLCFACCWLCAAGALLAVCCLLTDAVAEALGLFHGVGGEEYGAPLFGLLHALPQRPPRRRIQPCVYSTGGLLLASSEAGLSPAARNEPMMPAQPR